MADGREVLEARARARYHDWQLQRWQRGAFVADGGMVFIDRHVQGVGYPHSSSQAERRRWYATLTSRVIVKAVVRHGACFLHARALYLRCGVKAAP